MQISSTILLGAQGMACRPYFNCTCRHTELLHGKSVANLKCWYLLRNPFLLGQREERGEEEWGKKGEEKALKREEKEKGRRGEEDKKKMREFTQ
jgi:hypothetical protein